MEDNIVKSTDVAPQKATKTAAKKVAEPKPKKVAVERNDHEFVAEAPEGYRFIYFDSGTSYITPSGSKFTAEARLQMVTEEEAKHLLSFENFRLPDQVELLEYGKRIEE